MIIGIGVDTSTISRIEKSIQNEGFLPKVFGAKEIEMFAKRGNSTQTITANFAAKEAFSKAIGTGLSGFKWSEVLVLRSENGNPYFVFEGEILKKITAENWTTHVSLTHEGGFATAMVVVEKI